MKVLLISLEHTLVSFGVRHISSSLKEEGHQVISLFLVREFNEIENEREKEAIKEFIRKVDPDLIGISLMSSHMLRYEKLYPEIRSVTKAPILLGGVHPTLEPEQSLQFGDFICIGEGEFAIKEFVEAFERDKDPYKIKSIWANKNGKIIKNPVRTRHPNLDDFPMQDLELENQYILYDEKIQPLTLELFKNFVPGIMRTFYVMSSRGCPYACTYCCNNSLRKVTTGPYLRRRSVDNLINELKLVKNKYTYLKGFVFLDDSFLDGSIEWFEEFKEKYSKAIDLPFLCFANPIAVKEEVIRLLSEVGLIGVHVGLQSGSPRICRGLFKRNVDNQQFIKVMKILDKYRRKIPDIRVDVITDNPYETEEDTIQTIKVLNRIPKPYYVGIVALLFYPQTELTIKALKDGVIDEKDTKILYEEFFHYKPTYLNRLMRTTPVTPSFLVNFFLKYRKNPIVKNLFLGFYFSYYVSYRRIYRNFFRKKILNFILKNFEDKLPPHWVLAKRVSMIDF